MNEYILILRGSSACLPWRHSFETTSDQMAIQYASRALLVDPATRTAMRVELYNYPQDKLIAQWEVKTETSLKPIATKE